MKNISTIPREQKQKIAALVASLVPEGKKISSTALKPVLAGFDSGDKTEEDLGQAIIEHISNNKHLYGYQEPKPAE
jgi:hypothetical protein